MTPHFQLVMSFDGLAVTCGYWKVSYFPLDTQDLEVKVSHCGAPLSLLYCLHESLCCSPFFSSSQSIFIIFQPSSFILPLSNFGQLALSPDSNWGKNLNSPDELLSFCPLSFTWSNLPEHLYNGFFWWPLSYHAIYANICNIF